MTEFNPTAREEDAPDFDDEAVMSGAVAETEVDADETISVDFTGVDKVAQGLLLLRVKAIKPATSKAGNKMLNAQLLVIDGEDGEFNKRMVFESWMLTTDAIFRTKKALAAFLGRQVSGPTSFKIEELIGTEAWCKVVVDPGDPSKGYEPKPKVQAYGVKAP